MGDAGVVRRAWASWRRQALQGDFRGVGREAATNMYGRDTTGTNMYGTGDLPLPSHIRDVASQQSLYIRCSMSVPGSVGRLSSPCNLLVLTSWGLVCQGLGSSGGWCRVKACQNFMPLL